MSTSLFSKPAVTNASRRVVVTFCSIRNGLHCPRHTRRISCSSSANAGYAPADQQENDLLGGLLDSWTNAAARVSSTAVSRLADVLQSVAPPQAPRHKIEASVKGALVLLLLGLLKGVISFVLLVGCIGLAVYTATQVFGWNTLLLSRADTPGGYYPPQQQYPPGRPYTEPAPFQQQGRAAQEPYAQQHPQQQYGRRRAAGQQGSRPVADQGDVVDVFHYGQSGAQ